MCASRAEMEPTPAQAIAAVGLLVIVLVFALYVYLFNPRPFEGFTDVAKPDAREEKEKPRVE
jgi:hypothetical protein